MRHGSSLMMIIAVAVALSGCSKNPDQAVLARVNGAKITLGDFKRRVEQLPPDRKQAVAVDAKARQEFLEELVRGEVLFQEATRQRLDRAPEYRKQQEQLRKDLELRYREISRKALTSRLLQKELPTVAAPPTDAEVQEYFQSHRDDIRNVTGRDLTFKEALDRGLRNYVFQMKQQNSALDYARGLREKASVQIDAATLESLGRGPSLPAPGPAGAGPGKPPKDR